MCRLGACHVTRKRATIDMEAEELFKRESLACGVKCSAASDCSGGCPFCIGQYVSWTRPVESERLLMFFLVRTETIDPDTG